jgi:RNA polymerase sigma-70 factor (family 1)
LQQHDKYNEKNLLTQIAEGNGEAFRIMFLHYGPMLKSYLLKLSRSRETAEDIVHDVFLEIWKNREGLTEVEQFKPYLFRAVHNRAHRSFERQAKESLILHELRKRQNLAVAFEGEDSITSKEVRNFIRQTVDKLTPQQKKIFLLSRHQGLNHGEIAERLGISIHTVKNHMTDALRFLRNEIDNSYGSYALAIIILHELS